jgi:hypothetical protein
MEIFDFSPDDCNFGVDLSTSSARDRDNRPLLDGPADGLVRSNGPMDFSLVSRILFSFSICRPVG